MKLSELSFKVITGTEERNRAIQEALFAKGGVWINSRQMVRELNAMSLAYNAKTDDCKYPNLTHGSGLYHFFNEIIAPEVTLQQALNLIAQVEEPQPEFPFKPLDKIIRSYSDSYGWLPDFFSHCDRLNLYAVGTVNGIGRLAKFEGNEQCIANTNNPPEWWEIKDGKPVLVKN